MQVKPHEIKTEDDFNAVLDDLLKKTDIEVDEDSDEPVVFEYTDLEVKEMIVSGRVRMLIKHPFFGYTCNTSKASRS